MALRLAVMMDRFDYYSGITKGGSAGLTVVFLGVLVNPTLAEIYNLRFVFEYKGV